MFTPAAATPCITVEPPNFSNSIHDSNSSVSLSNQKKLEILKFLPKFNSHCHLGGEIPIQTLLKYANEEQKLALDNGMVEIASVKEYEKTFHIFPLISQIIDTHEKLKEATYQTCQRFILDNNQLVLLRTGLKSLESRNYEDYLKTVLEGIKEASSDNFACFLMLSLKRSSSLEMAKITVDLAQEYREKGVIGIDISDISTQGDINTIMPELLRAKENGLKIAVHMGESTQEQDQMLIINQLEPDLIDHGVNLCAEAENWIKNHKTPVTICLTSSIATKMHPSDSIHPWIVKYLESESTHPIDLGTDDSTVFGNIFLSDELYRLCSTLEFEKVVQIANESFDRAKKLLT